MRAATYPGSRRSCFWTNLMPVLKISIPHPEARHEADALRLYDGDGAVRLLRASEDGFTLLLERCHPGRTCGPSKWMRGTGSA